VSGAPTRRAADSSGHEADAVDREALFCALVLSPLTFPRNRFFHLFGLPWARRTRFRAAQVRSMLRHLSCSEGEPARIDGLDEAGDGTSRLTYRVPDLGLQRTAVLDRLELAILRFALARAGVAPSEPAMHVTEEDRRLVENALVKLGRKLDLGPATPDVPGEHAPDGGGS
jgi:hypothetical protein